ncbi:hypothetical protein D3C71_1833430 [compost metagenome]
MFGSDLSVTDVLQVLEGVDAAGDHRGNQCGGTSGTHALLQRRLVQVAILHLFVSSFPICAPGAKLFGIAFAERS